MAYRAPLTHTAAVLSGIFTPFPFDPAKAGTRRSPNIHFLLYYHSTDQGFCKDLFSSEAHNKPPTSNVGGFFQVIQLYFLRPEGRAFGAPVFPVNNPCFSLHVWIFIHCGISSRLKNLVCMQSGNTGHRLCFNLAVVQRHRLP